MKTRSFRLLLGLVAAAPLPAAFESATYEVTVEPEIPAVLRMQGLRDGQVVIGIDLSSDGRITDSLVLAASHQELVRPCMEAIRQWRFQPARYDGEPVPARLKLVVNLSVTGAVINRTVVEVVEDMFEQVMGRRFDFQMCRADEIDRPLEVLARVSPEYAAEAKRQGVGGRVSVHFYVDEEGNVRLPAVPAETHPYLSAMAVEAIRGWKFAPPTRDGRPVVVAAVQEFYFGGAPP